jgi:hypothetical protein
MVEVAEKLGFCERHAQHRHLQARKPHAHRRGNTVFGEDALEHQRHHLDDGLFARGSGLFLEFRGPLPHRARQLHHSGRAVVFYQRGDIGVEGIGMHAVGGECMGQRRRRRRGVDHIEPGSGLGEQAAQLAHDPLRPLAGTCERGHARREGGMHAMPMPGVAGRILGHARHLRRKGRVAARCSHGFTGLRKGLRCEAPGA